MSDLISRQAAIDAICNACGKIDCDKMDKCEKLQLSPANISETPNSSDVISRQAAIDAIEFGITYARAFNKETGEVKELFQESNDELRKAVERIKQLPPIQPDIVRCKDCKHRYVDGDNVRYNACELNHNNVQSDDWFCADGERREVTT
jgi:hypothetical protein